MSNKALLKTIRLIFQTVLLLTVASCTTPLSSALPEQSGNSPSPVETSSPDRESETEEAGSIMAKGDSVVQPHVSTTAVPNSPGTSTPPLDQVSEDFRLIGVTGRPQFVNTFAEW